MQDLLEEYVDKTGSTGGYFMEIVQSKWEQSHGDDPQDFGGRTVKKKYCGLDPAISMSISTTYGSIFQIPHYTHAPVQKNANVAFASCQVVDRALISSVDFDYSKSCLSNLADILIRVLEVSTKKMDNHVLEPSLYVIKGIAILDNDGKRILAKYYDPNTLSTAKEQKVFEKNLFNKTHRANTEIIMLENMTCVYKSNVDLYFYVMGSSHENELILVSVLNCLYDSISQILRKNVEKRSLMENLDVVMLALDEICDSGIILESDPTAISYRVALRNDDIPIGEQTVAQVLQSAKEQLKWSLLK